MGYEREAKYEERIQVVPIDNPYRFMKGLKTLINDVQTKHIESNHLGPSPFDPLEGTYYTLRDQKAYHKELSSMYKNYFGIHKQIVDTCTDDQKKRVKKILTEAWIYQGFDTIHENKNWRPGINHTTGEPYKTWMPKEHRHREVADISDVELEATLRHFFPPEAFKTKG